MDFGVSFSHPENAWLLAGVPVVLFLMVRSAAARRKAFRALGLDSAPSDFEAPVNRGIKSTLYLLGLFFTGIAAMGPQWGQKMQAVKAQGLDICMAIDLSRSMLTEDLAPNRLDQVKNQLQIFLPRLGGDRAALVGFAGSGYVAAPLSIDHSALLTFLDPMSPETISDQATNLSAGVDACMTALGLDQVKDRNQILDDATKLVVLISDGEDNAEDDTGAVARAEKLGVPVFAMAVGTAKGAPIPIRENGKLIEYVKDPATNQPVLSKLESAGLKKIVDKTGGKIFYASSGVEAWNDFEKAIADYKRSSRDAGTKLDKEERFQWPLAIAFAFLLLDFLLTETRWRWSLKAWWLVLLLPAFAPTRARASDNPLAVWDSNAGTRAFRKKEFAKAEEAYMKSLGRDAGDFQVRYNWAANKVFEAMTEMAAQEVDGAKAPEGGVSSKKLDEAQAEIERLRADPTVAKAPEAAFLRRKLDYQLGQIAELKQDVAKALDHYYRSLDPQEPKEGDPKLLQDMAKGNISRLLVAPPQSQSGQSQSQGDGGGGGNKGQDEKDDQQGKGKGSNYQQSGQNKPKFTGTDLNEEQAKQIMESVSGQEKEVLKRKAQGEAKEAQMKRDRDAREKGQIRSGRGKNW